MKIKVIEYDPNWIQGFETLRDFLTPSISDIALTVEHIGSTSVLGLSAKPIVDMVIVVETRDDVETAIERLLPWAMYMKVN